LFLVSHLNEKQKGLRDTAQHLTEIHTKCLKAAKSMAGELDSFSLSEEKLLITTLREQS